jgi:SagB-type dehydrogenase family enzyme
VFDLKNGKEFIEKTKYPYLERSDQLSEIPQPPLELEWDQEAVAIDLPQAAPLNPVDLTTAIQRRQSVRQYNNLPLSLAELSHLLWCTQGVKQVYSNRTARNVPSAGSRHALETWLVVNNVAGLQSGLYRYIASKHQLALITPAASGDIAAKATEICHGQPFVKTAAALFIWVAVPYRMAWRYGDRGYRYLHLDAGHVCQNLYLAAESIDAGVCAIAAYDDDQMNAFLGIDGENAFAIYMATVGKKQAY